MVGQHTPDEVAVELRVLRLGGAFSGVVARSGLELALGDEVFGVVAPGQDRQGFAACSRHAVARKPATLTHAEAALLAGLGPIALRAARLAGTCAGQPVLVTDATGAVGGLIVQIGRVWDWRVIAICADREAPMAWELGARDVLTREQLCTAGAGLAAIIDTDGKIGAALAARLLAPAGRLLRVRDGAVHVATADDHPIAVHPGGPASEAELAKLVELVEHGGVYPAAKDPQANHNERGE